MPRPLRFVILCLGRTGSTHLQSMLDFHSQARCHGEIFGEGKPPTFASSGGSDPQEFLDLMLAPDHERAVGFKLPMQSIRLDPAVANVALSDRDLAAIRLSRRDRLSQLVSRRMMAATGVSQSIFGDYGDTSVQIEPAAAIAALEAMSADEQELDSLCAGHPTFRIDYEELGDEPRLVELQRFLGLEPEPLRSWFEKLRTRSLPETVSNWDELQSALSEAGYGRFTGESPA